MDKTIIKSWELIVCKHFNAQFRMCYYLKKKTQNHIKYLEQYDIPISMNR